MARRLLNVAVIAFSLLFAVAMASAPIVLKAHRLVQFEATKIGRILGGSEKHGSTKSSMRGTAVFNPEDKLHTAAPLVLDAAALPEDSIADILTRASGGIVLLLPPDEAGHEAAWANVRNFEILAASQVAAGAVYAVEHSNATLFRARSFATVQLLANAESPKPRTAESSSNVVTITTEVVPTPPKGQTVVVQGGFDTLGAFPSLPQRGVAPAVVVAELAAMFAGQTATEKQIGLTFIASSGDRHSYHGLKKWTAGAESNAVLDKAEFVLCLENVFEDGELTLHSARAANKDPILENAAKALRATVKAAKIDPASAEIRHAHEVFAHKGYSSGTLTAGAAVARHVLRTTIARPAEAVTAARVASVANNLAKSLTALTGILPKEPAKVSRIQGLLTTLNSQPRRSYDMPASVTTELNRVLSAAAAAGKGGKPGKAKRSSYPFAPPESTFYSPDEAIITVYATQPLAFELTITAVIIAVMAVASFAILGTGALGFWLSPLRPLKKAKA